MHYYPNDKPLDGQYILLVDWPYGPWYARGLNLRAHYYENEYEGNALDFDGMGLLPCPSTFYWQTLKEIVNGEW